MPSPTTAGPHSPAAATGALERAPWFTADRVVRALATAFLLVPCYQLSRVFFESSAYDVYYNGRFRSPEGFFAYVALATLVPAAFAVHFSWAPGQVYARLVAWAWLVSAALMAYEGSSWARGHAVWLAVGAGGTLAVLGAMALRPTRASTGFLAVFGAGTCLFSVFWSVMSFTSYGQHGLASIVMGVDAVATAGGLVCLWKRRWAVYALAQTFTLILPFLVECVIETGFMEGRDGLVMSMMVSATALPQLALCFWVTRKDDAPQPSRLSMWVFRLVVLAVVVGVCVAARISPEMLEPPLLEERIS